MSRRVHDDPQSIVTPCGRGKQRPFRVPIALSVCLVLSAGSAIHTAQAVPGSPRGISRPPPGSTLRSWVRDHLGDTRKLSQGARAWLRGPIRSSPLTRTLASNPSLGSNVDANDPSKDVAGGQSETSIAVSSQRLLAAWNDASGVVFTDPTKVQASVTGVAYSNDGGTSFSDLIGLPNNNANQQWFGDPTVVAVEGNHFIVGSLYYPAFFNNCAHGFGQLTAAVSVATVNPSGNNVTFTDPIVVVPNGNACGRRLQPDLSLIDKEFLSYDPVSRTLAMSYTRFFLSTFSSNPDRPAHSGLGQIEMVRAIVPTDPAGLSSADFSAPIVIWHEESSCPVSTEATRCGAEDSGAYPSVAPGGDTYVAWERNLDTNMGFGGGSSGDPYVYIHAALVPAGAGAPSIGGDSNPVVISKGQVNGTTAGGVKSMDGVALAGYNKGPGNDLPRIAVDAPAGAVVFVWNDASLHPLGDIWLRLASFGLTSLGPIRQVNDDSDYSLHFLPAVSVASDGSIRTSWYDRRLWGPDSSKTDYFAEIRSGVSSSAPDFRVTTGPTDWANTSTIFAPNFGDYTDNATFGTTTYFIWSDGRLGVPQPFVDSRA